MLANPLYARLGLLAAAGGAYLKLADAGTARTSPVGAAFVIRVAALGVTRTVGLANGGRVAFTLLVHKGIGTRPIAGIPVLIVHVVLRLNKIVRPVEITLRRTILVRLGALVASRTPKRSGAHNQPNP